MQLASRVGARHDTLARDNEFIGIGCGNAAQLRLPKCSRSIRMQRIRADGGAVDRLHYAKFGCSMQLKLSLKPHFNQYAQ